MTFRVGHSYHTLTALKYKVPRGTKQVEDLHVVSEEEMCSPRTKYLFQ